MRISVFTPDLGSAGKRKRELVQEVSERAGVRTFEQVSFVGLRQTRPADDDTAVIQPFVPREAYTAARITNLLLRLAEIPITPAAVVELGVARVAPMIVEALLATNPDALLLDVSWAQHLKPYIEEIFPGPVYLSGAPRAHRAKAATAPILESAATVSIVLPTHNGSKYIRQSIASCLSQTHRKLELIVVDDGSAEDMGAIVREFTDPRVKYVRHERNRGLPAALNTGFRVASGEYLTWTSDDNYYAPNAIEKLACFLHRYPAIPFVYSSVYIVNEGEDEAVGVRRPTPPVDLKNQNGVGACFLYTREVYREIGEYDTNATLVEDYDYWIRVSKRFRMQRILEPLYYYRYHAQSLTSKYTREDVARRFDVVRQQNGMMTP